MLLVALIAGGLLVMSSHSRDGSGSRFGAYAGYIWRGAVTSVKGSWAVPRVIDPSASGLAATWIGVIGFNERRAFVQVGTEELRSDSPAHVAESRYWAFWTNAAHHFHPLRLLPVHPYDDVVAELTLAHHVWSVSLTDETSHISKRIVTGEDAGASFDEAQWAQEDPLGPTGSRLAYPSLSAVVFRRLSVNGKPPSGATLYSTWMSVKGGALAPTSLADDGFTIRLRAAQLTSNGDRYLSLSEQWRAAARTFGAVIAQDPPPSGAELAAATSRFCASLRNDMRTLASTRFPASIDGMAHSVGDGLRSLVKLAQSFSTTGASVLSSWRTSLAQAWNALLEREHPIRRTLGIPELLLARQP